VGDRQAKAKARSALVALVLGLLAQRLQADATDPRAVAARLRQLAGTSQPLPDTGSGITRDVGQVAVIEHDGSNYDRRLGDGSPNFEARLPVGLRFYETHGDHYDFLVVFTNFEFDTGGATAFHLLIRNDVQGTGKPMVDNGPFFGSPGRLKGWVDMAAVSRYRNAPLSLRLGDPGFIATLNIVAHEVAHQWLAEVGYKNAAGDVSHDLLGLDGVHWSYLLDSDGSVMYGSDWRDNGDGTFTAVRTRDRYSPLDRYLMGLLEPARVPPFSLLRNPAVNPNQFPADDAVVAATPESVTIGQVIAAEGPRLPDSAHSQKEFRVGFVFLTSPGTEPAAEDLQAVETVRRAFAAQFFALTHGVALADTTLVETPAAPRTEAPDLERALAWLLAQQALDGGWADAKATALRDTAAAVEALVRSGQTGPAAQRGRAWLEATPPGSVDFMARRVLALTASGPRPADAAADLLSFQNADGGFGAGADFASSPLDTALALRTLKAVGRPADDSVRRAVRALSALRLPVGGWAAVTDGPPSPVATAYSVLALQDWSDVPEAQEASASGVAALLTLRNPDGGIGRNASTPLASALTLEAFLRAGVAEPAASLVSWLQQAQLADGSWAGSRFQTALVLRALHEGVSANLVVPAESLVLTPSHAQEGETVHVVASVRNTGRTLAAASIARLFDGPPENGVVVAQASVPPLPPGQSAAVSFDFPTADRAGGRTLYVVADADRQVPESREDDNTTSRALTVDGLLADLVLGPADVDVSPDPPESGETVSVKVRVTNQGQRASASTAVQVVSVGDPRLGLRLVGQAPLPGLGLGQSAVVTLPWDTTGLLGDQTLVVTADPGFRVAESDETNNSASVPLRVETAAPSEPDLTIGSLTLSTYALSRVPETVEVRAVVRNRGRSRADSSVVLFLDGSTSTLLETLRVNLGPRSSETFVFRVSIATPSVVLRVVADPDDTLPEADETNNSASVFLDDAHTIDLEIAPPDVVLSSSDLVIGDTLTVAVRVANHGTTDVPEVALRLAHVEGPSPAELARTLVAVPGRGGVAMAQLSWKTSITGDAVPLSVKVDPFELIGELSETNNEVAVSVKVRPSGLPNLKIAGLTIAPDPPVQGKPATVGAVVANAGTVDAGPFAVRFYAGDPDTGGALVGESAVAGLAGGASLSVSVPWAQVDVGGTLGLYAVADALGQVEEFDETDNRGFRPFRSLGYPDLVLTAGDVALEPGYPRIGEPVTLKARVRNLGDQPSAATTVSAFEGEPLTGTPLAELPVPPLAPGASYIASFDWNPAGPPGGRTLSLVVDAGGAVVEADEGNNTARRSVVVQNADLFVTEPYFSPNGDGVKDETALGYRATGPVSVVVSNDRGQEVRRLLTNGPASGSVAWDGRDEQGRLLWDGSYFFTLIGAGDRVLGRAEAVLDTDRSPLHELTSVGQTLTHNVSCALPDSAFSPAWMPAEDEVLLILSSVGDGFPAGLVRVELDGHYSYVAQDPAYVTAFFPSQAAVSPNGREVLVVVDGNLRAVDLATGGTRSIPGSGAAAWSPDGRWIVVGNQVLSREGTVVTELSSPTSSAWAWSPGSDLLANGGVLVRRDGTPFAEIPLPVDPQWTIFDTVWRGDGKVVVTADPCQADDKSCPQLYLLDPDRKTTTRMSDALVRATWSPDGSKALVEGRLYLEDGTPRERILPVAMTPGPRSTAATFNKQRDDDSPSQVCGTKQLDTFVTTSLLNLTAELQVLRLAGGNGLRLAGTASDRALDRFQLEYARTEEPGTWHPIGPAAEAPVVDDLFLVWVPPSPGSYLVRLTAHDRAGNTKVRTRLVSWDRSPTIANLTQSDFFLSPNSDGVKETIDFSYLVLEPTNVAVRIAGPEPPAGSGAVAPLVRSFSFVHSALGPQTFTWDGRDDRGRVVGDGRYTVFVNDLPVRVDVDATPPDIALRWEGLKAVKTETRCRSGYLRADRLWHIFDPFLKDWSLQVPAALVQQGTVPIYVPETDGSSRPLRQGGRVADRVDPDLTAPLAGAQTGLELFAEDHAGNRVRVPVAPLDEGIFTLGALAFFGPDSHHAGDCDVLVPPPLRVEGSETPAHVYPLLPEDVRFEFDHTLRAPPADRDFHFAVQPRDGGDWMSIPIAGDDAPSFDVESFHDLGLDPTGTYRCRMEGQATGHEVSSETFLFRPCRQFLKLWQLRPRWTFFLETQVDEPLTRAWLILRQRNQPDRVLEMRPTQGGFAAHLPECTTPLTIVTAEALGVSGKHYYHDDKCQRMAGEVPACALGLSLTQEWARCSDASPDRLLLAEGWLTPETARIEVEGGPTGSPFPIDAFDFDPTGKKDSQDFGKTVALDVTGRPEGPLPVRGRITLVSDLADRRETEGSLFIDRTAPVASILQPVDGDAVCAARDAKGQRTLTFLGQITDHAPKVELSAQLSRPDGSVAALSRLCQDEACTQDPGKVATGPLFTPLHFDAGSLAAGDYEARLTFCDRSGNRSTTVRHFSFLTGASLKVLSVSRPVFSPNADGVADDTVVTVRTAMAGAILNALVHRGSATGPVVRTLASGVAVGVSDLPLRWDGKADDKGVVPDGTYVVTLAGQDACGGKATGETTLEVDTTPAVAAITSPASGSTVAAGVDVRGQATDANFASYDLSVGAGDTPTAWTPVAKGTHSVAPGGLLGHWDPPASATGPYTLRLVATDTVGNASPESRVTIQVNPGDFLARLVATPTVFSPNGDGHRDTSQIEYELKRPARVSLQIRDGSDAVVRHLETGVVHQPGVVVGQGWDGSTGAGPGAPDADYIVWIRAEDPAVPSSGQEQRITVTLDRTPPDVVVQRPLAGAFVPRVTVLGSITDRLLAEYVVRVKPAAGPPLELAHGFQPRQDADLASLATLDEGPYTLQVVATDAAENVRTLEVPFTLDAAPPAVAIDSPPDGAFLAKGPLPVPVVGRATDPNLESDTLGFGAGSAPASLTTIAEGTASAVAASWDVRFLPDGVYTLALAARDRAGQTAEARSRVTLDGLAPVVSLTLPSLGGYVTAPGPIAGSATDANLAAWKLESAPGPAATAFQWSPLGSGTAEVREAALADWSPLPPDGLYTLRLSARDRVDHTASTVATVTVDTTPPAAPRGLAAVVERASETTADVALTWNANTEPDLAGYRVGRDGAPLSETIPTPAFRDPGRPEGRYTYTVVALDRAGHASPPVSITVRVNLAPPTVTLLSPAPGAAVAGVVTVRGTAYSADDFREYRLSVGAGANPTSWTLLARSTVPVSAGPLGEWLALTDGPFVLALEADDTAGNRARTTQPVVVDTQPPAPPVLIDVQSSTTTADLLTAVWQASPSPDVTGYLVYRGGRLANAPGLVLDDLRGFQVPGPSYADAGLPDGRHCYTVAAMDAAGNVSAPSNEICRSLDNRAPRAVIVQPANGTRFGFPVRVLATTPDLDVASVRFQLRASGAVAWQDFGSLRTTLPYETTLDPGPLAFGSYDLRAVATDQTGHVDPDPAIVAVTYGDTTAPAPPEGLEARVDAADIALTWTASPETDWASYRLYRDGHLLAEGLSEPHHTDAGVAPGTYDYTVTAVDGSGNESAPSRPARAVVYALQLEAPSWPVTSDATAALNGDGSRAGTTVRVRREGVAVTQATATGGPFHVEGVPLTADGNVLLAQGEDAAGNRSIPSNEVVVIANAAPGAVTGLQGSVDARTVSLSWQAPPDPDVVGYQVRRGDTLLTGSSRQTEAASVEASAGEGALAFDQDPGSAWQPDGAPATWTATFPAFVLVDRVHLRFPAGGVPERYRIEVGWNGRFLPAARADHNAAFLADHPLPAPFATDAVRVVLESPGGLAEVSVYKRDASPATSFTDAAVPEALQSYRVTAIDRYGAEGPPATVTLAVGDVEAPGKPTGLVATPEGRDVRLAWNPNPEPDVTGYVLLRDGARIGPTATPSFRDVARPNGTYNYTVLAVDHVGHESPQSDPATALIDIAPAAPAAPVILVPTDAAHPLTLESTRTDVGGRAAGGLEVTLEVNGEARGTATAAAGLLSRGTVTLPSSGPTAFSPDGHLAAWSFAGSSGQRIGLLDLASGETRDVPEPGGDVAPLLAFSRDGALLAVASNGASGPAVYLVDVATGGSERIADGSVRSLAWSPDGQRLALSSALGATGTSLLLHDVAAHRNDTLYTTDSGADDHVRWSPDGTRLAFVRSWLGSAFELTVADVATGAVTVLDEDPEPASVPSWSADSSRVAFTQVAGGRRHVRVRDARTAAIVEEIADPTAETGDARFAMSGDWLSFVRLAQGLDGTTYRSVLAREQAGSAVVDGLAPTPVGLDELPDTHEWLGDRLAVREADRLTLLATEAGRFFFPSVALAPGENRLVARARDLASGLASPDSETVLVSVTADGFPDLAVTAAGLTVTPAAPAPGSPAQLFVRVDNVGAVESSPTLVSLRLDLDGTSFETAAALPLLLAGESAVVTAPWTPVTQGTYVFSAVVDPSHLVAEATASNNRAQRDLAVVAGDGLSLSIQADATHYAARANALVDVRLANAGRPFQGTVRTVVEDAAGSEIVLLDARSVTLDYGQVLSLSLPWNTGITYAGGYAFRVRAVEDATGIERGSARQPFLIDPDLQVAARITPERASVPLGNAPVFVLRAENLGANTPLDGLVGRLRIENASAAVVFENERPLPQLLPGATWEATDDWPVAGPAGAYVARFDVRQGAASLAHAEAPFAVEPGALHVTGQLTVAPAEMLVGQTAGARLKLTNTGVVPVVAFPVTVEVVEGALATVRLTQSLSLDFAAGETRETTVSLATGSLAPKAYVVRLRGGAPAITLDRARLTLHGAIAPPSIDAPADGSAVSSSHPLLSVNDALSPEGAPLVYEFQLFADAPLTLPLPGVTGVPQTPTRTAWRVAANLAEDQTYWWRARASDGFSQSPWSDVASFIVDALDLPPSAPLPDTPRPGARVASRQPLLTVVNGLDPEGKSLLYEFRVAQEPDMTSVLTSATGIAEGFGRTSWLLPILLEEDATYYWSARAHDAVNASPWSDPVSFRVDAVNASPSAPVPLRPVGGVRVETFVPELVVTNSQDAENDPLTYRFQIDRVASFDSVELQVSPDVPEGVGQTAWSPALPLQENTTYYWRAAASDGNTSGPWSLAHFFVNVANEAPGTPVPLDPVDHRAVDTATPTLRLRNTTDPDGDPLTYEFEVRDEADAVVASTQGVPSGAAETTWTVPTALGEDRAYSWTARASDGTLVGPRSAPAAFRVDALPNGPGAPIPILPVDGAVLAAPPSALVVTNASNPGGLALTYVFELFRVLDDGSLVLAQRSPAVAEGSGTTFWSPSTDLGDSSYSWRARASEGTLTGPWSVSFRFTVRTLPPAAPKGLVATPGDRRVSLTWQPNPEPTVLGYRVYRSLVAGGPYSFLAAPNVPSHVDTGLTNGVTYYYVVTARDARSESARSVEVAGRSIAPPPTEITAEIRLSPSTVAGECLLASGHAEDDEDDDDDDDEIECPKWLVTTVELPAGRNPADVDPLTARVFGSVAADPSYHKLVDVDKDGIKEMQLRFPFADVVRYLALGANTATVTGRAGPVVFRGSASIQVSDLVVALRMSPRTLSRKKTDQEVTAKLTFESPARAADVLVSSIRLNGKVPVARVVKKQERELQVEFDHKAVAATLGLGSTVEVRVRGTIGGLAFGARDTIKVTP